MAKLIIFFISILPILFIATPNTHAQKQLGHDAETKCFQNFCNRKENITEVHLFVQVITRGEDATSYEVARATITSTSPTSFGRVVVLDHLITAEPDINSKKLGRAQGLVTYADFETIALAMNFNIVFTAGEYNGSTISILGRNQMDNVYRELSVVGGTEKFRMARGYAVTNTYCYDPVTNYWVFKYILYVACGENA